MDERAALVTELQIGERAAAVGVGRSGGMIVLRMLRTGGRDPVDAGWGVAAARALAADILEIAGIVERETAS